MIARTSALWLIAAVLLVACQGPSIADGALACATDGSCPEGFECAADVRCYRYAGTCGDTVLDPGETCDPNGICPVSCSDGNACTVDEMVGSADRCNVKCERSNLTACIDGDKCCPAGCTPDTDDDCLASCNNGQRDPGETCDNSAQGFACIVNCDDGNACTVDSEMGSAANCNLDCQNVQITSCVDGDGCCAPGCNNGTDNDCPAECNNGVRDLGETCDDSSPNPAHACPTSCDDGAACTYDQLVGDPSQCTAQCLPPSPISDCGGNVSDGCCPPGCTTSDDADCQATCPNGQIDGDETCDPLSQIPSEQCPTDADCDDGNPCTTDRAIPGEDECHTVCAHITVKDCKADGCCNLNYCTGTGIILPDGSSDSRVDPDCGDGIYNGDK